MCWLCFGWLALPGAALALDASVELEAATQLARASEQNVMGWRLALATSALVLVLLPIFASRSFKNSSRKDSQLARARAGLLLVLALASVASYYDFFRPKPGSGFKTTDVFHYYMASKYFSEVGYFDLYHCTIMVLTDQGLASRFDLPEVRDQRTLHIHTPETALAAARQCRSQFSNQRWLEFARDIVWFDKHFQQKLWRLVVFDHGYNPSPVWNAVGGAITSRVPLGSWVFAGLIYADRVLMLGAFALIFWAFGLEVAALSAVVWGTGQNWSHGWIGDSLLRNLWLFAVIAGLCSLKRGKDFLAGGLLAFASLLRVFPAIFVVGFAVHWWSRVRRKLAWEPSGLRFARGVATASVLLLVFAAVTSDWGASVYLEFYEKISVFTDKKSLNKLGLSSLVWRAVMMGTGHLVTDASGHASLTLYEPVWLPYLIRGVQLAVLAPALVLFWRAAGRIRAWEASALGFALIPLLSDPANYYFGFVICAVMLSAERPRLQALVLSSAVLWIANALWFYRLPEEYLGASIIAILLSLGALFEMSRGPASESPERSAQAA